jgi:hypothetical protein
MLFLPIHTLRNLTLTFLRHFSDDCKTKLTLTGLSDHLLDRNETSKRTIAEFQTGSYGVKFIDFFSSLLFFASLSWTS